MSGKALADSTVSPTGFNDTSIFGIPSMQAHGFSNFPKSIPLDQRLKILEMHKASKLNAGIYIAIVLAIYLFLLAILLCRYSRKHRSSMDQGSFNCCSYEAEQSSLNCLLSIPNCFGLRSNTSNDADSKKIRANPDGSIQMHSIEELQGTVTGITSITRPSISENCDGSVCLLINQFELNTTEIPSTSTQIHTDVSKLPLQA